MNSSIICIPNAESPLKQWWTAAIYKVLCLLIVLHFKEEIFFHLYQITFVALWDRRCWLGVSDSLPMINDHLRGHASRAAGCTPSAFPEVNQRSCQRARWRHRYTTMKKGIGGSVSVHCFTTASRGRGSSVFSPPVWNHRKLAQSAVT